MSNVVKNREFSSMLAQHKVQHPNAQSIEQAEAQLGQGAILYQLDREGALKLLRALSAEANGS